MNWTIIELDEKNVRIVADEGYVIRCKLNGQFYSDVICKNENIKNFETIGENE